MSLPGETPWAHLTPDAAMVRIQKHGPYWVSNMAVEGANFAESGTSGEIRAVPLRPVEEQAVLRWHPLTTKNGATTPDQPALFQSAIDFCSAVG